MVGLKLPVQERTVFAIAGGGTGGHLYPALAIAEVLRSRIPSAHFVFFSTHRRIDDRILGRVDGEVVRQTLSPLSPKLWRWPRIVLDYRNARRRCREAFERLRPVAVIGTGGLASVPAVVEAVRARIPSFVLNPDAIPGKANCYLARFVDVVFAQWRDSISYLPRRAQVEVSGCAIRPEFAGVDRAAAARRFGLDPSHKVLLVTGASQGARTINDAVLANLDLLESPRLFGWQVLHLSGDTDVARVEAAYKSRAVRSVVKPYTDHMPEALSLADLVISRAGASTLAELTAVGRASILIPYPFHRDMHQLANAQCLAREAAAQIVLDKRDGAANAPALRAALEPLMVNDPDRDRMADAARRLGRADAALTIAQRIISHSIHGAELVSCSARN